MKSKSLVFLTLLGAASAFVQPAPGADVVVSPTKPTAATATITLGDLSVATGWPGAAPALPSAPFTFRRGSHLRIVVPTTDANDPRIVWYKDDRPLAETTSTLDIPAASTADSGSYTAVVHQRGGTAVKTFNPASIVITETGGALLNISTRARLNAEQPTLLTGFVVQPGPAKAFLLIRAVGPTLAQFGVTDALAEPRLRILDSAGNEVPKWNIGTIVITDSAGNPLATPSRAGEFPLPPDGKDVEQTYMLPPGAYTAEVSSMNSGKGSVLLEIYQLPL